jgi:hypothetical protein
MKLKGPVSGTPIRRSSTVTIRRVEKPRSPHGGGIARRLLRHQTLPK